MKKQQKTGQPETQDGIVDPSRRQFIRGSGVLTASSVVARWLPARGRVA